MRSPVWKHPTRLNFLCNHLLSVYSKCCICTSAINSSGRGKTCGWLLNECNKDTDVSPFLLFLRLHLSLSLSLWLAGLKATSDFSSHWWSLSLTLCMLNAVFLLKAVSIKTFETSYSSCVAVHRQIFTLKANLGQTPREWTFRIHPQTLWPTD